MKVYEFIEELNKVPDYTIIVRSTIIDKEFTAKELRDFLVLLKGDLNIEDIMETWWGSASNKDKSDECLEATNTMMNKLIAEGMDPVEASKKAYKMMIDGEIKY